MIRRTLHAGRHTPGETHRAKHVPTPVSMSNPCTVCGGSNLRRSLEFGQQPASNRFLLPNSPEADERHPLSLGYCTDCSTVQLVDRMPIEAIRPRFDFLQNTEPEGHLDDLVDKLAALPGMSSAARILGVTYKDRSTLERFARRGMDNVTHITPAELLPGDVIIGLETLQRALSDSGVIDRILRTHGAADLLIVRHLVEHAESASRLVETLRGLLKPGGRMMFEFPDNERIFRNANHAFIWEEHFSYFTRDSFYTLADRTGARVLQFERYPYPYEDALVAVLQFDAPHSEEKRPAVEGIAALQAFAGCFSVERARWHAELSSRRDRGEKLAIFGAGHLAVKLINFMDLAQFIDCVIDDNPRKAGLQMPGSRLEIVPSGALAERGIRYCISTLSPESETSVRRKLAGYVAAGGSMVSAFSTGETDIRRAAE